MTASARSQLLLPDSRTLAWAEYGDPAGAAVLNHHGGLLSCSDVGPLDDAAREAGVRLISFDRPGRELLSDSARGSVTQDDGWVEEYRAWVRPWGFALGDLETPVDVWQGSDDHLVPAVWAERMADELPSATLHLLGCEGHFLLLNRAPEVLSALTA
jgi:pimeloyl-ACP methyl ester carboxylesterase